MLLETLNTRNQPQCHQNRPLVASLGKKLSSSRLLFLVLVLMIMITTTSSLLAFPPSCYHKSKDMCRVSYATTVITAKSQRSHQQRLNSFRLLMDRTDKDWDKLLDEDDENGPSVPKDMRYIPRIVQRQHQNFVAIRQAGGKEVVNDVYMREPKDSEVFWFVGKVARISDVTLAQCIARQWNLIETHAANLRPMELFPARGSLEIWTAPGDSELDVAYNRPEAVFQKQSRDVEGAQSVKNNLIGFQGEVYDRGEQGFRTWRLEDGRPARPELQGPSDDTPPPASASTDDVSATRAPTDEEMEKLQKALQGKDVNELYEEQQRREGKPF